MKVILAEKPSVAKDIAAVVGAAERKNGYFRGNGYLVTYAFGHLITFSEPEEMNPSWGKPWRIEQLPMIPTQWKYTVVEKAAEQYSLIKKLFLDSETTAIICATDAGREGEHIFRLIYNYSGCTKPVERLWISSLTAQAISDGLSKLRPMSEFDNLARSAAARAQADWVVGLNFTRAYTTMNRQLCTIGRVQTPTLALIVERQKAIDSFKSSNFYEILVTFAPGFVARYITPGEEPQTRLQDKTQAQEILNSITPNPTGTVISVVTAEKRTRPPALYDLLTLQKDANKRFGYTAKETLDIAQNLYEEHKLISYPRTESRHLSNDMVDELPGIVNAAVKAPTTPDVARTALAAASIVAGKITADILRPYLTKNYLDDNKLTDHHAIIPTHKACPSTLPEKQRNIYQLVSLRFLSIFLPAEVRDETTAIIKIGDHSFRARGVVVKEPGWTIIEPKSDAARKSKDKQKDSAEESQKLPPLSDGQQLDKQKAELKEKKTSAPKPYDDATLLTAMKNAGQELDDEDLAAYMKQRGLGTPATRAAIIERLLQSGYIERKKSALVATEKGVAVIDQVHTDLKDVKLTASWEQRLADMQDGALDLATFESDIAVFVRAVLPSVTGESATTRIPREGDIGACPKCSVGSVRFTPKGAGCTRWREGCTFSIWREQYGKELKDTHIKDLIENKITKVIKGFKKKDGKGTYDAQLALNDDFKVRPVFSGGNDVNFGGCPQCKDGFVRTNSKGVGCSRWKEGCTLFIWRVQYGKELSDEQIKALLEKKKTDLITGFQKKSGSGTYDAYLVLDDQFKVRLEFGNQSKSIAKA